MTDLIEFGEVARQPIGKYTLLKHWTKINNCIPANSAYTYIYYKGGFYELNDYIVKQIDTNEYISKIKLVRCL